RLLGRRLAARARGRSARRRGAGARGWRRLGDARRLRLERDAAQPVAEGIAAAPVREADAQPLRAGDAARHRALLAALDRREGARRALRLLAHGDGGDGLLLLVELDDGQPLTQADDVALAAELALRPAGDLADLRRLLFERGAARLVGRIADLRLDAHDVAI